MKPSSFPSSSHETYATATMHEENHECIIVLSGDWEMDKPTPSWKETCKQCHASTIRITTNELKNWDTALLLFLIHGRSWCLAKKKTLNISALPSNLQRMLEHAEEGARPRIKHKKTPSSLRFFLGTHAIAFFRNTKEALSFIGDTTLALLRLIRKKAQWRPIDFLVEMQHCWGSSLPIVSLISFLVGVILAFQSAIQLRQYGASIFVADLVGLAVVREMGPMMAAIVVAGGTGAGFAAQLGNMKVDEEIDALETIGLSAIDFLILPRLLAATIMMPVLAIYANILGILGGTFIGTTMLNIPISAYWIETQNRVRFTDVSSGLIKSFIFGILIAMAGCYRGIHCEQTTEGVGNATSSAVVTSIMLIIIADALFAIIYNALGI